ncbi:MAG: hypothetical protein Q7I98_08000 [Erysipelotrichaceae bacterium]|nr:hypothetical protein [Erysipelotrichaceae bacterium]
MRKFEASLLPYMKEFDRKAVIDSYRQIINSVRVDKKVVEDAWQFLRDKRRKL